MADLTIKFFSDGRRDMIHQIMSGSHEKGEHPQGSRRGHRKMALRMGPVQGHEGRRTEGTSLDDVPGMTAHMMAAIQAGEHPYRRDAGRNVRRGVAVRHGAGCRFGRRRRCLSRRTDSAKPASETNAGCRTCKIRSRPCKNRVAMPAQPPSSNAALVRARRMFMPAKSKAQQKFMAMCSTKPGRASSKAACPPTARRNSFAWRARSLQRKV